MTTCQNCGGDLAALGYLGSLLWCRCRDCGLGQTVTDDQDEEEDCA